ncbi:hypothetical protein F5882DRAFT_381895 [Hyaloscypha sp. PMI_1271]|nr:hypothetical protein F5882DRAFT_381895 [Hyaloscypha sp. PMI_1271]
MTEEQAAQVHIKVGQKYAAWRREQVRMHNRPGSSRSILQAHKGRGGRFGQGCTTTPRGNIDPIPSRVKREGELDIRGNGNQMQRSLEQVRDAATHAGERSLAWRCVVTQCKTHIKRNKTPEPPALITAIPCRSFGLLQLQCITARITTHSLSPALSYLLAPTAQCTIFGFWSHRAILTNQFRGKEGTLRSTEGGFTEIQIVEAKTLLRNYKARFTAAWKLFEKELRIGALRVGNDMDIRLFEMGADMILVSMGYSLPRNQISRSSGTVRERPPYMTKDLTLN